MVEIPQSLPSKWVAEGKGKGPRSAKAEYLDREPALVAEHVLACSQRGFA